MKRIIVMASLLGALALGAVWFLNGRSLAVEEGEPAEKAAQRVRRVDRYPGVKRTVLLEEVAKVAIRVEDGRGELLSGEARWCFLTGPRIQGYSLSTKNKGASIDGKVLDHKGVFEVQVPPRSLLWLYLVSKMDGKVREHYRLIDPAIVGKGVMISMNRVGGAIHVFLLDEELERSLRSERIGFLMAPLDGTKPPTKYRVAGTNDRGYACLERAEDGIYFVMSPGSERGDMPPYTERVILGGASGVQEAPVLVQAKEKRPWVELDVHSRLPLRPGQPSVLFARRLDGGNPELIPLMGSLPSGKQSVKLKLPDGRFELSVLPEGVGIVEPSLFRVEKGRAAPASFGVKGNPRETQVELVDFNKPDLPAKVWYRPGGRLLDENRRLLHTGPLSWRINKMGVQLPGHRGRFVVWNKVHYWISSQVFEPGALDLRVKLEPATRLQVRWKEASALTNAPIRLIFRAGTRILERVFEKTLVPNGYSRDLIRLGTVVLPRGPVQVEAIEADTKRVLWTRSLTLAKDYETLEIPATGSPR
jgi:hypothetical protein